MANQLTISGPALAQLGESIQIGPILVQPTITPLTGSLSSVGAGSFTIAIPIAAAGIAIFPPTSNTATLTIKGLAGDQGYSIPKTSPFFTLFDQTLAGFNIVLTTSAAAGVINYTII